MASNSSAAIRRVKTNARLMQVFGWIIVIPSCLFALVGLSQITEVLDVVMVIFFFGIATAGIFLMNGGNKRIKLINDFYNYSARLAADPEKSIDLLASSIGVPVTIVMKNITEMITLGFLSNCALDGQRNRLIMPVGSPDSCSASQFPTESLKRVSVLCDSCGATTEIIVGATNKCEFCGSPLLQK